MLALLYDPNPPVFTCIEEIDHGLHPQALELVVQRLREAAERTQLIVATHSSALVNRLRPKEFVVCDRDDDGASIIWKVPAELLGKDTGRIRDVKEELKRGLGLPVFRESDGPAVAHEALTRPLIPAPRGSNCSYDDFVGDLTGWS